MAFAGLAQTSWRQEQAQTSRLAWAFVFSIVLHLLIWGTYYTGKKTGLWQRLHLPAWMHTSKLLTEALKKKQPEQPQVREIPLIFVDVDPAQATVEAPKKTDKYSDRNSIAANPDPEKETATAKIDGKQAEIIKTADVPRAKMFPLQPSSPSEPAKEAQEELKPKPTLVPGDLTVGKPEPKAQKEEGNAPRARPKTIAEANARANNRLTGEKMKQEGGVRRIAQQPRLDVMATGFGAYDLALVAAVQNRWYGLIDARNLVLERSGKVTVTFHLNSDGSITQMDLKENTVDLALALLCQSAIRDPAPYATWPSDMKREIGADYRDVSFTFYYSY